MPARSVICAFARRTPAECVHEVGAQLVDGVELGYLARPFVGDFGQHFFLDALDEHAEVDFALAARHVGVERDDVARLRTTERGVESVDKRAAPDLVGQVGGVESGERLVVLRAVNVDDDVVARTRVTLDVVELRALITQAVDLRGDVVFGRLGLGTTTLSES